MNYPAVCPHGDPIEIGVDLFVVLGSVRFNPIIRFSRNMTIVRHAGELTLINPVRMSDSGLQKLEALGAVKNVLRLGPFHGMDDPFYVDRYKASFWSFAGGTTYTEPKIDFELSEGSNLPFPDAHMFSFGHITQPEGALLLRRDPGVLLTSDAIQHYGEYLYTNLLARLMLPRIGFPLTTLIGPIWIKTLAEDKALLKGEFRRLLELDFDQLMSSHGTFLDVGAHAAVERAFATTFA